MSILSRWFNSAAPKPIAPPQPQNPQSEDRAAGLTPRDIERLAGVHPDLVRVVKRARSRVAFFVAEGVRSHERQRQLVSEGKSKTLNSRHLTGHAVDLYPVSDIPIPKMKLPDFKELVDAMRWAAAVEGVPIVCGFDWGWDAPHYELPRASYPADERRPV